VNRFQLLASSADRHNIREKHFYFYVSMSPETHSQLANFIWSICNLLRGPYKRNEYRKVILPLTVLRRFDCLLAPTKDRVLKEHAKIKSRPETVIRSLLQKITGRPFYNLSKLDMAKLLDDPNQLAPNLNSYIHAFSKNVREIMERFAFEQQIARDLLSTLGPVSFNPEFFQATAGISIAF